MVKLQLELGGKDPGVRNGRRRREAAPQPPSRTARSTTPDRAVARSSASTCTKRSGTSSSRRSSPTFESFKLGDPSAEDTYIGPLARRELAIETSSARSTTRAARARRSCSEGSESRGKGWFFAPTVLMDVDHEMRLMREESFGPVIGLMKVTSDAEALELMNDTEYGLTAAVYGRDAARAERLLERLDVGSAYFNCCDRVSPRLPWSGRRHSGIGSHAVDLRHRDLPAPESVAPPTRGS